MVFFDSRGFQHTFTSQLSQSLSFRQSSSLTGSGGSDFDFTDFSTGFGRGRMRVFRPKRPGRGGAGFAPFRDVFKAFSPVNRSRSLNMRSIVSDGGVEVGPPQQPSVTVDVSVS